MAVSLLIITPMTHPTPIEKDDWKEDFSRDFRQFFDEHDRDIFHIEAQIKLWFEHRLALAYTQGERAAIEAMVGILEIDLELYGEVPLHGKLFAHLSRKLIALSPTKEHNE